MTFTECLTYIVPIVPIVLCPLISTLVRYLDGTANIELQELEKDMENTDSPEVDVLGFVYESTKEELDKELSALRSGGVMVRPLSEWSPDLMTVSTRSITDFVKPKVEYICNYCGTRYVSDENGFIPNCHNCGARLDKENKND